MHNFGECLWPSNPPLGEIIGGAIILGGIVLISNYIFGINIKPKKRR